MAANVKKLLAQSLKKISDKITNKDMKEFSNVLYSSVSKEDLQFFRDQHLCASIKKTFELLKNKFNGSAKASYFIDKDEDDILVLQIIARDIPFLIDSISNFLKRASIDIHLIAHGMFYIERNKKGEFVELASFDENASKEYVIQIHISNRFENGGLQKLIDDISGVLKCIEHGVTDWLPMRNKMMLAATEMSNTQLDDGDEDSRIEAFDFLNWLIGNHFIYLGYAELELKNKKFVCDNKSKLGVLKDKRYNIDNIILNDSFENDKYVTIRKSDSRSVVHRSAHMDMIIVKKYSGNKLKSVYVFYGLFTSTVYYQSVRQIPLMRKKVEEVVMLYGYPEKSHNL